jgi:hypothetical protein
MPLRSFHHWRNTLLGQSEVAGSIRSTPLSYGTCWRQSGLGFRPWHVRFARGLVPSSTTPNPKGWRTNEAPLKAVTLGLARQGVGNNFAAMPYAEVPSLVTDLMGRPQTTGRDALMFLLFTAARSGEVRSARWFHIDLDAGNWNRPADLMKNRLAHTVTLNQPAIDLLRRRLDETSPKPQDLIFPARKGGQLSDMTITKVLRSAEVPFTAHGFRSSFRDWAAEMMPTIPDPVAEAALAHVVPDKVIAAYKRTSFLVLRRELLAAWGAVISGTSCQPGQAPAQDRDHPSDDNVTFPGQEGSPVRCFR